MDADAVVQDTGVDEHESPHVWRTLPNDNMKLRTTFYYYGDGSVYTTVSDGSGEDATVVGDNRACTTVSNAVPASLAGQHSDDATEDCKPFDVADPEQALNEVSIPHCFTHKPVISACPYCVMAKRRHVRKLTGMSITLRMNMVIFLRCIIPRSRKGLALQQLGNNNLSYASKNELAQLDTSY